MVLAVACALRRTVPGGMRRRTMTSRNYPILATTLLRQPPKWNSWNCVFPRIKKTTGTGTATTRSTGGRRRGTVARTIATNYLQHPPHWRYLYPTTTTTMRWPPCLSSTPVPITLLPGSSSLPSYSNKTTIGASSLAYFSSSHQNNNNPRLPTPPPPPPSPPPKRSLGNWISLAGTGAFVLFGKTKYILTALKLTKLAPLASMVFTVGTYSLFFGLPYATGIVGLILIHEIGHAAVMHARGVPFSPMVFIPFMGAVIATKELPRDAWEDALIAFGGPVLGSLGAGAVGLAGHSLDSQLLIALADFGLMINLFNLLPLGSMDGGRIAGALSPYMSVAGVALGTALAYEGVIHNPIFYLILLSGGYQTFQRFYQPTAMPLHYYKITPLQRGTLGVGYVGLVCTLALAMDLNGRYKKSPEVLQQEYDRETTWDMR